MPKKKKSSWPEIDLWRMSASRPWQLEKTHGNLLKYLKYSGKINYHLIESYVQDEYSDKCVEWGNDNGYQVHIINPQQGQGYAMDEGVNRAVTNEFALKWEDDFMPIKEIPLNDCVLAMEQYPGINQICFNKRETMAQKEYTLNGKRLHWMKEQREFEVKLKNGRKRVVPLVIKEKWWFGSAIWRMSFIKPIFKFWNYNTHNFFDWRGYHATDNDGTNNSKKDKKENHSQQYD